MGTLLQGHLSLYDRMLLRKYSGSGPSDCSSLSSIPPTALPVESTKKRRRVFKKAKLCRDMKKEAGQVQEGSPCGFSSQVAEPPVRAATIISHSAPSSAPSHFTLLYFTLVQDGALALGYLQEFISLEAPARRSANRLQASAVAVSDSAASMTLVALRRESEHRASVEKSNCGSAGYRRRHETQKIPHEMATYCLRWPHGSERCRDCGAGSLDPASGKLAQVHGHPDGEVDQGESEQHSVARRRSPCGNSQVKSSVCAEIPWLAERFPRCQFSSTLEAD